VTVVCTKNNLAAPIAAERRFRIGPDEDGRFTLVPAESSIEDLVNAPDSQRGYELMRIQNEVVELAEKHARRENRVSQTQLELTSGRCPARGTAARGQQADRRAIQARPAKLDPVLRGRIALGEEVPTAASRLGCGARTSPAGRGGRT
jgi:hypothetical protein